MMRGDTLLNLGHGIKCQGHVWHFGPLSLKRCGHEIHTVLLVQSLLNFTYRMKMTRRGIPLFWGFRVKGQGKLWHLVY